MGIINDAFQSKLSLSKLEEILNNLLKQGNPQNKQVLQEIGLLSEYSYIKTYFGNNDIIYYSKSNKIVKNVIYSTKMHSNFLEWTRYLFDINDNDLNSIQQFDNKIENFKKKLLTKEFFQNNIKKYLFNHKGFNKLLNYGIPNSYRLFIWDIVISEKYNNRKYFNYEQELREYKCIMQKPGTNAQIEKDLNRTFMKESDQNTQNINILRNILNNINKYNPGGYCQGMNYIVGYLLKLTKFDEVKTFYIFKSILNDIKGYFEIGFPLLKNNNIIFNQYFKEFYPKVFKHFQKNDIVNEFWVGKWFQTLFTLSLPYDELNIVWDSLLIKGFDFIIYICLALVDYIEKDVLELKESSDIISFLEKVLNYQNTQLTPANKNTFEDIDNYIIPLNEVLQKANELKKKVIGEKDRHPFHDRRSDSHLLNFRFNHLKTESDIQMSSKNINNFNNNLINKSNQALTQCLTEPSKKNNIINNNNSNNTNNTKLSKSSFFNSQINQGKNNNINISNFNSNNSNNSNNYNINNYNGNDTNKNKISYQTKKSAFFSTKDLGTYNFNDLSQTKKRGSLNQNAMNNNINYQQQYQFLNNGNISNIRNNNYLIYYP